RLTSTGAADTAWNTGGGTDGTVEEVLITPGGAVVARGTFHFAGGQFRPGIARFSAAGPLDATFQPGDGPIRSSGFDLPLIRGMALGEGGTLVLVGEFERFSGRIANHAVRLTES